jgi:hypothetical protein
MCLEVILEVRPKNVIAIELNMKAKKMRDQLGRLIIEKKYSSVAGLDALSVNGTWFVPAENPEALEEQWLTTRP